MGKIGYIVRPTLTSPGDMGLRSQSIGHGSLLEVRDNTDRLRSAGFRHHAVPRPHRYFAVLRLPRSFGRRSGFPRDVLPRCEHLFLIGHTCVRRRVARWRLITGSPYHRNPSRGDTGVSQVTEPSSSSAPKSFTPRRGIASSPIARRRHCCLQVIRHPGLSRNDVISGPQSSSSLARCLRFVRTVTGDRRKGSLPTCRAQLWSGRDSTCWMANRISRRHHLLLFLRTSIAWPHRIITPTTAR